MYIMCFTLCEEVCSRLQGTNPSVEYLSPATAIGRVVSGLPQILNGGRFFDKQGRRVSRAGERYKDNGVKVLYDDILSDTY